MGAIGNRYFLTQTAGSNIQRANNGSERNGRMRKRRFDIRSLIGTVAVLGLAAILADPAPAQQTVEARTGHIRKDCTGFTTQKKTDGLYFEANCRVSDDNNDKAKTSINLSDDIGFDKDKGLHWDGSDFESSCPSLSLHVWTNGVQLFATCVIGTDPDTGAVREDDYAFGLEDRYKVNDQGKFEVK